MQGRAAGSSSSSSRPTCSLCVCTHHQNTQDYDAALASSTLGSPNRGGSRNLTYKEAATGASTTKPAGDEPDDSRALLIALVSCMRRWCCPSAFTDPSTCRCCVCCQPCGTVQLRALSPTTHAAASSPTQGLAEAEEADPVEAQPPPAARKQAPPQLKATGSGQIGAFYPKEETSTTVRHCCCCCPAAQPPSTLS
jgi:hypothetical protein